MKKYLQKAVLVVRQPSVDRVACQHEAARARVSGQQHRVRHGDGQFEDIVAVLNVAKVQNTGDTVVGIARKDNPLLVTH